MTKANWRNQTVRQVAKRLGIGYPSLCGAIRKGEVRAETFNGVAMIPRSEEQRIRKLLGIDATGSSEWREGEDL